MSNKANFELHLGDCLETLRGMADNSVDAVVTDPPYLIGFMGKGWDNKDGIAGKPEVWRECLRVLKPGGHLLSFAGARTYHRITCAIEDAGFEIRDQIMYLFGVGFPKSHNLDNLRGKKLCGCTTGTMPNDHEKPKQKTERNLRPVSCTYVSQTVSNGEECSKILHDGVPQQSVSTHSRGQFSATEVWGGKSSVEGRCDGIQKEGELQGCTLPSCARLVKADGSQGWLPDGASLSDGELVRIPSDSDRSCAPCGSQPIEQCERQSGTVANEPEPQAMGAWPVCGGCGLPVVPRGFGTALKPAHEPICVARKPLSKGNTVAANVLQWGTGAINVDGCRVVAASGDYDHSGNENSKTDGAWTGGGEFRNAGRQVEPHTLGRWPANLIHDGSEVVVAGFPVTKSGSIKAGSPAGGDMRVGDIDRTRLSGRPVQPIDVPGDSGSAARFFKQVSPEAEDLEAARFFYCAKASKKDRSEGLDGFEAKPATLNPYKTAQCNVCGSKAKAAGQNAQGPSCGHGDWSWVEQEGNAKTGNIHPTVKPTDLMAYLVRLVTPPGGTVLDPFMGSGSTGKACMREGFRFIGCELDPVYLAIARARIEHELTLASAARTPKPQAEMFA